MRKIPCHISDKTAHLYNALCAPSPAPARPARTRTPRMCVTVASPSPHRRLTASPPPHRRLTAASTPPRRRLTAASPPRPRRILTAWPRSEASLEEPIDKTSSLLSRECRYTKKSRIARLPPYLTVQFVRFAWRKDTAKRAKILRPVSFPDVLDVRNLLTPDLQKAVNAWAADTGPELSPRARQRPRRPLTADRLVAAGTARSSTVRRRLRSRRRRPR